MATNPTYKERMQEKLDNFERVCREAGLRVTHQRIEIFRELSECKDHPSAEALYKRMQKKMPTLSQDTVYRTLATFEEYGLITRVQTVEQQARFEAEMDPHHHLICSRCKEIIDFTWEGFDESDLPNEIAGWGKIQRKNVVLHGVCAKCMT